MYFLLAHILDLNEYGVLKIMVLMKLAAMVGVISLVCEVALACFLFTIIDEIHKYNKVMIAYILNAFLLTACGVTYIVGVVKYLLKCL